MIGKRIHRRGHGLLKGDARADVLWLLDHPEHRSNDADGDLSRIGRRIGRAQRWLNALLNCAGLRRA